jgi:hypothetical protein
MTWQCIVLGWGIPLGVWFAFKVGEVYVGRRKGAVGHVLRAAEPQPIQQVPRRTRRQLAPGLTPKPERVLSKPERINKDTRGNRPS